MVTDQNDPCCQVPDCPRTPAPIYVPTTGVNSGPTTTGGVTPTPGVNPTPQTNPFLPNPKGMIYHT